MTTERPNTLAGLIEKHREIAGQIEAGRKPLNALVFDLEAVEHTIWLFDPDAQLRRAKPLPSPHAAFKARCAGMCWRRSGRLRGRSRRWISRSRSWRRGSYFRATRP